MYNKSKPETIQSMFDQIANNYDRTNAVLSFCMHHLWNASLVRNVVAPCEPKSLADLCAGTGEIAFRCIKAVPSLEAVQLIDFSEHMLEIAKKKAQQTKATNPLLSFLQADVHKLPLPDNSVDCTTMAYGIRNVCDPSRCLREIYRILQPGGSLGILELTEPENFVLKWTHTLYLRTLLPLLGKIFTSNKEAYEYLCSSIHTFVKPATLKEQIADAGFRHIRIKKLSGGIATIFIAQKIT